MASVEAINLLELDMIKISEIMTRGPAYLRGEDTVQAAAQVMADMDIGAVPVCQISEPSEPRSQ